MLTDKRIKEAKNNVKSYFNEVLLKKVDYTKQNVDILIRNSNDSLKVANFIFEEELSTLWAIVISYYFMYYMANAALLNFGYKVGDRISHKVTNDALIVFIRKKLKSSCLEDFEAVKLEAHKIMDISNSEDFVDDIIESFELEKNKRAAFQYNMDSKLIKSGSKSKTSLNRAKNFITEVEKLI